MVLFWRFFRLAVNIHQISSLYKFDQYHEEVRLAIV